MNSMVDQFLDGSPFAVVGASTNREKYGNKVLRCYLQNKIVVFPVNPRAETIEGLHCFASLNDIETRIHGISIITPPSNTETIIQQAVQVGIKHVWMQPGAESKAAIELATKSGMNVIAGGPCILVVLGYYEE